MPIRLCEKQEAENVPAAQAAVGCWVRQSLKALSSTRVQHGAPASSRFLGGIQYVRGTKDVHLPFQLDAPLVDTVLCDSSTSVHLPDAVCNINGDFFCRHSLSISFSLLKNLMQ